MDWSERIGRRVRLRDLHIVLAVAESGSMAKASARLSISHPVVSKAISELEQTLGVSLFDRSSQGVEPTPYGRALLEAAVNVFDEERQGFKRIEFLADPTSGELDVGCPEIILAGVLPAITEHFLGQHPRVQLRVIHADTALMQFDQLRKHNVELLIGRMPRPFVEEDLVSEPLFDEPFAAMAGKDSRWARRRQIELAELAEEAWVLPPPDSVPGVLIAEIFREHGLQHPRAGILTLSVQLTTTMIATGRFVGMLPGSVARFSAKRVGLKILPVKVPTVLGSVNVITVKNRTPSPLAQLFIGSARAVAKSISAPAPRRKSTAAASG
jgi:DNA-binding transcriptional LysR family regulator